MDETIDVGGATMNCPCIDIETCMEEGKGFIPVNI